MESEAIATYDDDSVVDYSSLEYDNETLDYRNIPYLGEIKNIPLYEIILKSYLYAMIIFFSLVGNTLIIVVVLRHKQMRTTTNFYIVNLAVADILVTIFCTWVHLVNNLNNNNWVLGGFFCKFNTFSQVLCLVASVLSLTLIAYDRFFGIVFAMKAHMSRRKARFSIAVIWLCACAIAAPLLWFRELKERQWQDYTERWCDDSWPVETRPIPGSNYTVSYMPSRTVYFTFVSAVLYFFPMFVMALAYSIIIRKLRSSTIPGKELMLDALLRKRQKESIFYIQVIAMLATIMAVFGVCWLPYQIVLLYSELRETRDRLEEWFFTMQFLAGCFAYSNSAVNPLIYAGFNKNFKEALLNMRSGFDTLDASRRRSLPYLSAQYRRGSKVPFIYTNPSTPLKKSSSSTSSQMTRGMSFDSAAPLLSLKTVDSPPDLEHPTTEMLAQIQKYRVEAEKHTRSPELSPLGHLNRSCTQRRGRNELEADSDISTPRRRHSVDSFPFGTPPICTLGRNFGE